MTSNFKSLSVPWTHWFIPACLLTLMPIMALGIVNIPSIELILLAACALGIVAAPLLGSREIDWFSPWNRVFYSTFVGVFLRSIYITFDIPDEFTIRSVLLRGEPKEFLLWPMVVVLLGLCFTTFGYFAGPVTPRKIPLRIFQSNRWSKNRLWFVLVVLLSLSWIGFYFFIANTGGSLDVENLSRHRGISNYLSEYASYSYFRWMINLSDLACFLVVVNVISTRHIRFRELIVFLLSLGTSLFYYYYVQKRSGIITIVISVLAIVYYLRNRKFPVKSTLVAAPIALFITRLMTILRPGSGYAESDWLNLNLIRALEPMIVSFSGIDVSKTAHIMAAVGKQLDYQWGGTLLNIFTIWIPRQLWPGKPTNVDTIVGMAVFGAQTYGAGAVPPGLIAEMYWNFWLSGVIVGCFLVGYLLRIVYTQFRAYSSNRNIVLLYVTSFMSLGVAFMGSGFASTLTSFLMTSMPLFIVLYFITERDSAAD